MPLTEATKNIMLDAVTFDRVRLHSGAPGASGTANALGAGLSTATFAAASGGERALASAVTVTGLSANQSVTHYSVWTHNGGTPIFRGDAAITTGDTTANSAGEYTLTTGNKIRLRDPA